MYGEAIPARRSQPLGQRRVYSDPGSLRDAFVDPDKVLLAYTSIANADHTSLKLAAEHQTSEQAIADSGLPYTLLRNSWYLENCSATGRAVGYRDLPAADYTQALVRAGVPEPHAAALADSDLGIARGDLHVTSGDLARLIGRPTTSMPQAVQEAAAAARLTG